MKKFIGIIKCSAWLIILYIAIRYGFPWARIIVFVYACICMVHNFILAVFMSEEERELHVILRKIEKDLAQKGTISQENRDALEKMRNIFTTKSWKSFFRAFK